MGFKFKYERLLSLKIDDEEYRKVKLAEKITELTNKKEELSRFIVRKNRFNEEHIEKLKSGVSASVMRSYNTSKIWFMREEGRLNNEIALISDELVIARENLKKANMEVKKLEKLKEKDALEYIKKQEKDFDIMIDELISFRFNR